MKYKVMIEKINDEYLAYCSEIISFRTWGKDIGTVLDTLHRDFVCYLHDAYAEIEIVIDDKSINPKESGHYLKALQEGRFCDLFKSIN